MAKVPYNQRIILPICNNCKTPIYDLHVEETFIPGIIPIIRTITPRCCPECYMVIHSIEYNVKDNTVIVKGSGY